MVRYNYKPLRYQMLNLKKLFRCNLRQLLFDKSFHLKYHFELANLLDYYLHLQD